ISEEKFMENSFTDNLKLRASYGQTGNYSIPNYGSIGLLRSDRYVFGSGGGNIVNAIVPSSFANSDLGWEKTQQYNFGFEFGILNNRIYTEVDYYISTTNDLLLNVPVPRITGSSSALKN